MDYDTYFREHLEALHREGRYRVFAELKRRSGAYPTAEQFTAGGVRDVTGIDEPARKGIFISRAVSYMCLASAQV